MPNQRKKSKVHLGGWYEKALRDDIRRLAKERGITLSQFVEQLLEAGVADYKRRQKSGD